jgi:hypothetical protein
MGILKFSYSDPGSNNNRKEEARPSFLTFFFVATNFTKLLNIFHKIVKYLIFEKVDRNCRKRLSQLTKNLSSVPDPDPDPHVFVPPGSGSTGQRYGSGSGSGSFYHHAKIVRKPLIPSIL